MVIKIHRKLYFTRDISLQNILNVLKQKFELKKHLKHAQYGRTTFSFLIIMSYKLKAAGAVFNLCQYYCPMLRPHNAGNCCISACALNNKPVKII